MKNTMIATMLIVAGICLCAAVAVSDLTERERTNKIITSNWPAEVASRNGYKNRGEKFIADMRTTYSALKFLLEPEDRILEPNSMIASNVVNSTNSGLPTIRHLSRQPA